MQKVIVLAYPGAGKTYLVNKYKNIVDNDFCYFKFLYDKDARLMSYEELESKKGNKEIERDNPDYPNNLIEATRQDLNNGKVVLIPLSQGTFKIFNSPDVREKFSDTRFIMIYPSRKDFDKYIERFRTRGNSEIFMEYNHIKNYFDWLELFKTNTDFEKVNIRPNEYLENILLGLDVVLK